MSNQIYLMYELSCYELSVFPVRDYLFQIHRPHQNFAIVNSALRLLDRFMTYLAQTTTAKRLFASTRYFVPRQCEKNWKISIFYFLFFKFYYAHDGTKFEKKNRKFPIFSHSQGTKCRVEANNNRKSVVVCAQDTS